MRASIRSVGPVAWQLLAVLLVAAGCGDPEERAGRAREQAEAALAAGEREQALAAIRALGEATPDDATGLAERARLLTEAGEAARAVWLLEAAITRFPDAAELRLGLARAALWVNDPARAAAALEPLLAAGDPPDGAEHATEALLLRARAAMALGDLDEALALFRRAERRDPRSAAVRGPRIGALLAEGRLDEAARAVADAQHQAGSEEDRALARHFALALHQLRTADASSRMREALQVGDPRAAEAAGAERARALADLGALARGGTRDAAAWQAWILGLASGGEAEAAARALEEAQRADPEWLLLHALQVPVHLALGDAAGAEAALRELAARDPSPGAVLPLVRLLAAGGREAEAEQTLAAALDAHRSDPQLLYAWAELRLDAEAADAEEAVARFAEARPGNDPHAALLRARLTLLRGDAAAAAEALRGLAPRLDTASTQYWLGRALEAEGDRTGAERRYALAALRAPSEPGSWLALARLTRQRGAWPEAAAAGRELALRAPARIEGWETWVEALLHLREPAAALDVAERCEAALPEDPASRLLRARALRAAERPEEAGALLASARERFGDRPDLLAEQVLARAAGGRSDEALVLADQALAAGGLGSGDRALLHHARAMALFGAGRWEEGARAIDRALEAGDPRDPRPLRTRCRYAAATGRFDAAVLDCERYLAARPADAEIHFVHGVALESRGAAADAMRAYAQAARLDPRAAAPRNNLALLRRQAGDLPGALEVAQHAYALAPEDPQVLDTLAELYLEEGLGDRAVALLEQALALAPDDAEIARRLAEAREGAR